MFWIKNKKIRYAPAYLSFAREKWGIRGHVFSDMLSLGLYGKVSADDYSECNYQGLLSNHLNDLPVKFSVCVNDGQDKLPTMYWLPKLHKKPYKARFIAKSSSCTTT